MCLVALIQLSVFSLPMRFYFPFFWQPIPLFWSHVDYFGDKVECKCWNCNNDQGRALAWGRGSCECGMHVAIVNVCVARVFFSPLSFVCESFVHVAAEIVTAFKLLHKLCQQLWQSHSYCFVSPKNCWIATKLQQGKNCNVNQVNYKVINNDVVGKCVNRAMQCVYLI